MRRPISALSVLSVTLIALLLYVSSTSVGAAPLSRALSDVRMVETCTTPTAGTSILMLESGSSPYRAIPYPSSLSISGQTGTITEAVVKIYGLNETNTADLDVLLEKADGGGASQANIILFSDVGGGDATANDDTEVVTFRDGAPAVGNNGGLPAGTYAPTNRGGGADVFPSTAPSPSGSTLLSTFDGLSPNGAWRLYVVDDSLNFSNGSVHKWCVQLSLSGDPTFTPVPGSQTPTATATATATLPPTHTPTHTATVTPSQRKLYLPMAMKPVDLGCATQERNPNDTRGEADSSQNLACFGQPITGSITSGDPRDYYYFDVLLPGATVSITLDSMPLRTDNDVALYNSAGTLIAYAATAGNELIPPTALQPGRYYVMVYPYQTFGGPYRLTVTR